MKRREIDVIVDDDLIEFLKAQNLYQDFTDKKILCYHCNEIITNENIFSLFLSNDKIQFCCIKAACTRKL